MFNRLEGYDVIHFTIPTRQQQFYFVQFPTLTKDASYYVGSKKEDVRDNALKILGELLLNKEE